MKKLIFLFLLIPIIASGQITSKILPSLKPPSERIALAAYEAESEAIFAAMGTTPDATRKLLINDLVKGLKDDGIWSKLDFLYLLASHAENSSLLNWINPGTFDATNVHETAFEVDRGYTGDGANDYLDTNWNPNSDGINYTLNYASLGAYVRSISLSGVQDMGGNDGTTTSFVIFHNSTTGDRAYINAAIHTTFTGIAREPGFKICFRDNNSTAGLIMNGDRWANENYSVSIPNANFYLLCVNSIGTPFNFTDRQMSAAFAGAGLTEAQGIAFTNRIETFMDAIGAGVIT